VQASPLGKHLLRYTYLLPPLFDGKPEPALYAWLGSLFDGIKSVAMMTISLQTISDNLAGSVYNEWERESSPEKYVYGKLSGFAH
jgi:hypothetical protein